MPLQTHLYPAANGRAVAEAVLDNPASLNALNHELTRALSAALQQWRHDDSVAAVVLRGAGDKAFCAGGDVRYAYQCVKNNLLDEVDEYFADEYCLDYALHCYDKPVVCWGGGVVMGGGMGMLQGCDVRVITPASKMAMPEHKIGFFPDVGAAYFLRRFCGAPQSGYCLALAGTVLSAAEALQLHAADFILDADSYADMLAVMCAAEWENETAMEVIQKCPPAASVAAVHDDSIIVQNDKLNMPLMRACYAAAQTSADAALAVLPVAARPPPSPLSVRVWTEYYCRRFTPQDFHPSDKQCSRGRQILREALMLEYILAMNFMRRGDFAEGVRALLIDKDNAPQWHAAADDAAVAAMFDSPAQKKSDAFGQRLAQLSQLSD